MVVTDSTLPGMGEQPQKQHPLIEKLLRIKHEKRTNLCVAADGMTLDKTLRLLDTIGPHISILKIHSRQFGPKIAHEELMEKLFEYKKKYNFLLFEDAKFFDGAETVRLDYEAHFAKYVDIVTVVPLGDDILQAIAEGAKNAQLPEDEPRGCLAVCELSFANIIPLESGKYLEVAKRNPNVCIGFIGQRLPKIANMIKATPGINLKSKTDGVNQQWRTPDEIKKDGADIFIVGRGITAAPETEWESLVLKYKELCYC